MSLLNNNKKSGKKANQPKTNLPGAQNTFMQSNKNASMAKKPVKTGGTRGS